MGELVGGAKKQRTCLKNKHTNKLYLESSKMKSMLEDCKSDSLHFTRNPINKASINKETIKMVTPLPTTPTFRGDSCLVLVED